uniref:DEAD/SNF2-like helicase n=1 Tax=Pithovirus LCPAC304 TaxID=2506594 RepID=A0A481ZC58_9VIRU|nr:MAG: DEAD/SNF2-like helicase [Pithovirus LCPAC304]
MKSFPTLPEKRLELEDLLAFYPTVDDKNIQTKITIKKEFNELASEPSEKLQGKYFKHQLLVQRLLQAYDDLFLFHDTGTGKSRILDLIGEHFRKNWKTNKKIQKVLVLVRSDILKSQIERQIVEACTDGTYDVGGDYPSSRKTAVRKKIKEWYRIVGYQKLARELERMDDTRIVDTFSGHLLFFDEVHNIRIDSVDSSGKGDKKMVYEQIYRLFHLPNNIKRVLATATPMINIVKEIGPLMNLILPKEKQFPIDFPYETANYEDYEPYFRGRVSYVRSLDTGINIRKIGIPVNEIPEYEYEGTFANPQIRVFPNYMSEFQNEAYLRASDSASAELKKKKTFYHSERQAANFVYPNGVWGSKGFRKYTQKLGNVYYPTPDFKKAISTIEGIRKLSVKVANMIEIVGKVKKGGVYIYDNFVEASGAITIALCFQAMGYEIFNESSSVFRRISASKSKRDGVKKEIRPQFKPKMRIGLFTGMTSTSTFESMIELMNSPENKHGDYLKVFITSPTGSEGISLNNVISIHISSGDWKYATPHQAKSRAIRATSHELLLEEKQKEFLAAGLDPALARVDVDVYFHGAISRGKPAQSIDAYLYTLAETKDRAIRRVQRFMKRVAVDSQIHYDRNVRADDQPGTIENDYLSGKPYEKHAHLSEETDYSTYDVHYIHEPVSKIITFLTTYFQSHFSITIEEMLCKIASETDIPPRLKYLHFALKQMIVERMPLTDRYGYSSYLEKDGDVLFITREFVQMDYPTSFMSYYTQNIIASCTNPLRKIKSNVALELQTQRLQEFKEKCMRTTGTLSFDDVTVDICAKLLEEELSNIHQNPKFKDDRPGFKDDRPGFKDDRPRFKETKISTHFSLRNMPQNRKPSNFYVLHEPITELRKLKAELIKKEQGRGRKPKFGIRKVKFKHYDPTHPYEWDEDTDKVCVHTLYTLQRTKTRYADKTRYFKVNGRIRILKTEETRGYPHSDPYSDPHSVRWRDATPEEAVVYSLWIQKELHWFKRFFEERSLVYGYYLGDHTLTIRNKIDEDPLAKEDKRKLKTGRVCNNITPPVLVKILEYLDVDPPKKISEDIVSEELLKTIVKTKGFHELEIEITEFDIHRLRYFASWILVSKSTMCKTIENTLKERDLLFRTL